MKFITS